jgi:mono/diheme cytochrome c family protein
MNKFLSFLAVGIISVGALTSFNTKEASIPSPSDAFEIPENINAIFKNSCYGCHNSESKNEKGREKLMIDELTNLKKGKLAAKLNKIAEITAEGEMPPEKFLNKYPDKALSEEDAKTLIEWAKASAEAL